MAARDRPPASGLFRSHSTTIGELGSSGGRTLSKEECQIPPAEPALGVLANPILRYFLATRPAFLSVTLFACLVGFGAAYHDGVALGAAKAVTMLVCLRCSLTPA